MLSRIVVLRINREAKTAAKKPTMQSFTRMQELKQALALCPGSAAVAAAVECEEGGAAEAHCINNEAVSVAPGNAKFHNHRPEDYAWAFAGAALMLASACLRLKTRTLTALIWL